MVFFIVSWCEDEELIHAKCHLTLTNRRIRRRFRGIRLCYKVAPNQGLQFQEDIFKPECYHSNPL